MPPEPDSEPRGVWWTIQGESPTLRTLASFTFHRWTSYPLASSAFCRVWLNALKLHFEDNVVSAHFVTHPNRSPGHKQTIESFLQKFISAETPTKLTYSCSSFSVYVTTTCTWRDLALSADLLNRYTYVCYSSFRNQLYVHTHATSFPENNSEIHLFILGYRLLIPAE